METSTTESSQPSTGEQNTVETPATAQAEKSGPEFVTKSDFGAILKRIDSQSALINKLQKRLESTPQEKPNADAPKPDPLAQQVKELVEERKIAREKEERRRAKSIRTAVKSELLESGVNPQFLDDLSDLLVSRNSGVLQVDDDDNVFFRATDDVDPQPVQEWVKTYLATDKGRAYLKPKQNPSSAGLSGRGSAGANAVRRVTAADLEAGRVTTSDVLTGKVIIE